jgi:hypothetical protein
LSKAKHLWLLAHAQPGRSDQRFLASLGMTTNSW